jgi:hypothetical protein
MIDIGPDHQLTAVVVREKLDAPGAILGVVKPKRNGFRQRIWGERRKLNPLDVDIRCRRQPG